jgi:hypothetical protein
MGTFASEMDTNFWLDIWRLGSPLVLLLVSRPFSKCSFNCWTSHYFKKTTKEGGEYFAPNKSKVIVASDENIISLFFFILICLKFITDLERCARQAWESYFGICLNKLEPINSYQRGECDKNQGCGKDLYNRESMKGMWSVSLWIWICKSLSY